MTPDIAAQLLASEWSRFAVSLVLTPAIVQMLKPYLPTGSRRKGPDGAVENRWAFLAAIAVSLVLNVAPALYLAYGQTAVPAQNVWGSVALGLAGGIIPAGAYRGVRLTLAGDETERENARMVRRGT